MKPKPRTRKGARLFVGRNGHQTTSSGTTTYAYFDDDQIQAITTPDPDTARSGPG